MSFVLDDKKRGRLPLGNFELNKEIIMSQIRLHFALLAVALAVTMLGFETLAWAAQSQTAVEEDPLDDRLPPGIKVRAFIHRPRVVEHNHLGTCTTTTPKGDTITNYGLTGWHLPAGGVTWKLNESSVPASVGASAARATIQSAFDTWNAADSGKNFSDGGSTTAKNTRFDGTNAILWKRLSPSTIGVTYVWYYTSSGEVAEVDTAFNNRYPWAIFSSSGGECQNSHDAYDLQDIATHEFGHWAGLEDLYNDAEKDLTMYGFGAGGELKKRTLGTGDINGANAVAP